MPNYSSSQTSKCQKAIDNFHKDVARARSGERDEYDPDQLLRFMLTLCYCNNISLHSRTSCSKDGQHHQHTDKTN